MNNKPLIGAAVFTFAALIFLIWSNASRSTAEDRAEDDANAWTQSLAPRQEFTKLVGHPDLQNRPGSKTGAIDIPTTVGDIVREVGMKTEQVRIDATSAATNEQAAYRIRISNISVAVMGKFLDRLRRQHGYLTSREITMSKPPRNTIAGLFHWSMVVGVPKTGRK